MSFRDDWPKMPDGTDFDGRHLLALVRDGKSPFHEQWDVNLLVQEIEKNLNVQVDDIPYVSQGSNCYVSHEKKLYKRIVHSMLTRDCDGTKGNSHQVIQRRGYRGSLGP